MPRSWDRTSLATWPDRPMCARDLVFLDPPYEVRDIVAPLRLIEPTLAPGGMVVVKHFWRTDLPVVPGLGVARQRRFGETMLTFMEADQR